MAKESIIREYKDEIAGNITKLVIGFNPVTQEALYYGVTYKSGLNLPTEDPNCGIIDCHVFSTSIEGRKDAYLRFGKIVTKAMKSGYLR